MAFIKHGNYSAELVKAMDDAEMCLRLEPIAEVKFPAFLMCERHSMKTNRLSGAEFWGSLMPGSLVAAGTTTTTRRLPRRRRLWLS